MMEYRIQPISKVCAGTGQPLVPGTVCHSVLVERDGGFQRLDFSPAGWTGFPENAVGGWRSTVPIPETRRVASIDTESLLQFFEQLLESPNRHEERLCFVVALSLLQRRRLKLDGSRSDGDVDSLQLSGSRGEGPYEVRNQQMTEAEISELRSALDAQLTEHWKAA